MSSATIEDLNRTFKFSCSDHRSKKEIFSCIASLIDDGSLSAKIAEEWLQEKLGRENILYNLEYYKAAGFFIPVEREIKYLVKERSVSYIMGNFDDSDIIMILLKYENPNSIFKAIGIENILKEYDWNECYSAFRDNRSINEDSDIIFLAQAVTYFHDSESSRSFQDILSDMENYIDLELGDFYRIIDFCNG